MTVALNSDARAGDPVLIKGVLVSRRSQTGGVLVSIPGVGGPPLDVHASAVQAPERERFTVTDLDFDENRAALAKNIRTLRQRANMTQEDLGRALHVSQSLVYNWEHGIGYPRPDRMVAMARMFGVTVSALMGDNL